MRRWLAEAPEDFGDVGFSHDHLYYSLDHQYTEASISLANLKTKDRARVQCLQVMASELDLDIFLAVLEKEEQGSCEFDHSRWERGNRYKDYYDDSDEDGDEDDDDGWHCLDEVFETNFMIKKLVDLNGHVLLSQVRVDEMEEFEENMLQEGDPFEGWDGEEDYEGYMGNSGPQATHWYRFGVAVIIPRQCTGGYLGSRANQGNGASRDGLIQYFADRCLDPKTRPAAFNTLKGLCENAWKRDRLSGPYVRALPPAPHNDVSLKVLNQYRSLRWRDRLFQRAGSTRGRVSARVYFWLSEKTRGCWGFKS